MTKHTRLRPSKIRNRLLGRDSSSDESGFVLIVVMILSVALFTMLTYAVASSVGNLHNAADFSNISQAQNTAMTGLSAATNQMVTASAANLPCSVGSTASPISMLLPQVSGVYDTYSVAIKYSPAGTGPTCNGGDGSLLPASAVLTSTGTTPHTHAVTMQENLSIGANAPFTYALFSYSTLFLSNGLIVNPGSLSPAKVYGGTLTGCTQGGTSIQGSVQMGSTVSASVTIGQTCEITGNLYVNGDVTLSQQAKVDGSIYAYGGNINIGSHASVLGSAYATGSISDPSSNILGSALQNLLGSSMPVGPPSQTLPQLSPTAVSLAASVGDANGHYTVISIPGSSQPDCSTAFMTVAQATYTQPTAIYAPNCAVIMSGNSTFSLGNNEIWVVGGLSATGSLKWQSGVSSLVPGVLLPIDLSVIVPISDANCSTDNISLKGNTRIFDASINVALYTPCNVTLNGNQTINGQILAGGTIDPHGATITFNNSEDGYLPGTQGGLTVNSKTVVNG